MLYRVQYLHLYTNDMHAQSNYKTLGSLPILVFEHSQRLQVAKNQCF